MPITEWQGSIEGLTFGAGTSYPLTGEISGMGIPAARTTDTERAAAHGDIGGLDTLPRRILTVPLGVNGSSSADALDLLAALKVAWAESGLIDRVLTLHLPGLGERRYYGRPRGLETRMPNLRTGWIDALGTFDALDPYAYGPAVGPVALGSGSTVVAVTGDAPTDRIRFELTGSGSGTSGLTHLQQAAAVTWAGPLTATRRANVRDRTVATTGGADRFGELAAGARWWNLTPGNNTLSRTGASAATVTYEPAYR